jgi:predicted phosphodiesterase
VRYLILSDIHANWHALEAVLEEASGEYESVVCCGDLVGYCADPNPVVDWVRANCAQLVRGNHDKACAGLDDLEWFNPVAKASAVWTINNLRPENADYLRAMARGPMAVNGYTILHGSPADEDDYLVAVNEVAAVRPLLEGKLSFFGHTHIQGGFLLLTNQVIRIPKTPPAQSSQVLSFEPDVTYLVNPGSVGQPRDGDPRAAYVLFDSAKKELSYHRVLYDVEGAQNRIRQEKLPDILADRLKSGS